jgi:hypothetical protein
VAASALVAGACLFGISARAEAAPCPTAPSAASLPSAAKLKQQSAFLDRLGVRPTGSRAQRRYVAWIRRHLSRIDGVTQRDLAFPIRRWSSRRTTLSMNVGGKTVSLPVANAVPYSKPTSRRGARAKLAFVPDDQRITADNSAGKIVVRPAPAGSVPQAAFLAPIISWGIYDPDNSIDPTGTFYGDFINYNARVADLRDAATAGAKGILFVKDEPRRQLIGHYEPYEGTVWKVPGAFLGVDEGQRIMDAINAGKSPSARLAVSARVKPTVTRSVLATVPGQSKRRIVIDSHTDGTNAVEDNGPIAMVAMARYLAKLPMRCRPRTVQFAFSTAHFYQRLDPDPTVRDGGAEQLAKRLDRAYDRGTVSVVLVLEHLGAIDYQAAPRSGGKPGDVLRSIGERAIQFIGVTPSQPLVNTVDDVVRAYDMRRTILLQGSDAPGPTVPAHCSFGGEGTPYERHLLPTIGVISAPMWLYDPAFGLEAIDFKVMHSEVRGFTDLVNRLGRMDQARIAGSVEAEREQRALGAPGCPPAN